jgi:hypothetical protein
MASMLKDLLNLRRRQTPRSTKTLVDRRTGAPDRHRPDPMPRIRWYS